MIAVGLGELLLIYLFPIAVLAVVWLLGSGVLYMLIRLGLDFDFKHDIVRKFDDKSRLPSGRDRLSFFYVAMALLGDSCIQAVLMYRISSFLARHRLRLGADGLHAFSRFLTHTDLSPLANIGPGFYLYHGLGTVIGKGSQIGRHALICQGVSVGGGVTLGDEVKVWAGAQILRGVTIGDRTEVGANAVVMNDFPADTILFGVPARLAGAKSPPPDVTEPAES